MTKETQKVVAKPVEQKIKKNRSPKEISEQRAWIMENIFIDSDWNLTDMARRFGEFEHYPSPRYNPRIIRMFYFSEIDVTFMVNIMTNKIQTYRFKKADD